MAWLITWLVQGLAIAGATALVLRRLSGLSASTRYAVWWTALALVLALPLLRVATQPRGASPDAPLATAALTPGTVGPDGSRKAASVPPASVPATQGHTIQPLQSADRDADAATPPGRGATPARAATSPSPFPFLPVLPALRVPAVPDWLLAIVIGAWLGAAMLGLLQTLMGVRLLARVKAACEPLRRPREAELPLWSAVRGDGRKARVRTSTQVRSAAVLGLVRPVIAIPRRLAASLTPEELDQVIIHEYAHVQRYDDWTKLIEVLVQAFAGWHPAVRLILREMDFEREAACDDRVVEVTGAPRAFARCLTRVAELTCSAPPLAAVPYAASSGSHTSLRIERLLACRRPESRLAAVPVMGGALALTTLAFCTVHALPVATDFDAHHRPATSGLYGAAASGSRLALAPAAVDPTDAMANAGAPLVIAAASMLPLPAFVNASADARRAGGRERELSMRTIMNALGADRPTSAATHTTTAIGSPIADGTMTGRAPGAGESPVVSARADGPRPADVTASETPTERQRPASTFAHGSPASARARTNAHAKVPAGTPDRPHAAAGSGFSLGPVIAASDSNALIAASSSGPIDKAWDAARGATVDATRAAGSAVALGARKAGGATGDATRSAGTAVAVGTRAAGEATAFAASTAANHVKDATVTATGTTASSVKTAGAKTGRFLGRVTRSVVSVF